MNLIEKLAHTFVADFLNENSIVLDLGGNKGEFAKFLVDNFNCLVYTIEPVEKFFNSIPNHLKIKKFKYCISATNGSIEIFIDKDQLATFYENNPLDKIVCEGITIEKFINDYNIPKIDLLKVDIEGAEIEIFENLSSEVLRKINQITIEFHDFLWPELKPRVENIKKKIKSNGFYCVKFSIKNNGDVLFIRKSLINKKDYLYLQIMKYILAFKRVWKKIFK